MCAVYGIQEYVRSICAVYGIHEYTRRICAVYGIHESICDTRSLSYSVVVLIRKERERVCSIWDTRVCAQYVRSIWDTREYMWYAVSVATGKKDISAKDKERHLSKRQKKTVTKKDTDEERHFSKRQKTDSDKERNFSTRQRKTVITKIHFSK